MERTPDSRALSVWESEGGATLPVPRWQDMPLTGTVAQIQWAEIIRNRVDSEFDRVAFALQFVGFKSTGMARQETRLLVSLLEEIRAGVLANTSAGYFIREWQEMGGRVSQLIIRDPRYRNRKAAAAHPCAPGQVGHPPAKSPKV